MIALKKEIAKHASPSKAKILQRFFKTRPGEYGEGDVFLGIRVPKQREIAKQAEERLTISDLQELLNSKVHEERLISLLILIEKYKRAKKEQDEKQREFIFNFYLENAEKSNINNWDLVDLSAPNIPGDFLLEKPDKGILYSLAKSENLWGKRIAIISTFTFIRKEQFKDTLKISELLLKDKHDLIHKAVGWMLREIGKRNQETEEDFLKKHYKEMPRTMLRYAIERFPEDKRKKYLKGEI